MHLEHRQSCFLQSSGQNTAPLNRKQSPAFSSSRRHALIAEELASADDDASDDLSIGRHSSDAVEGLLDVSPRLVPSVVVKHLFVASSFASPETDKDSLDDLPKVFSGMKVFASVTTSTTSHSVSVFLVVMVLS